MQEISKVSATAWHEGFSADLLDCIHVAAIQDFLSALNHLAAVHGICTGLNQPLRFVPQEQLPADMAYETFIAQTGSVPTRDNWHDRYNALMWLTAPKTKALLNRLQHQEIVRLGGVVRRGPVRDALTIWDENLAVLVANDSAELLKKLLETHDWQAIFLTHRSRWHTQWHVRVFGHALMEKLRTPFKAITAHVVVIEQKSPQFANWLDLDSALLKLLSDQTEVSPRIFSPLPVMGVPGWCAENAQPEFYFDTAVFRPKSGVQYPA